MKKRLGILSISAAMAWLVSCVVLLDLGNMVRAQQKDLVPRLEIVRAGEPEIVSSWSANRCETADTPDAPPRAYRDQSGQVHFFSTFQTLREYLGPELNHLKYECRPIAKSGHDDDYSKFNDLQWFVSFYTKNGRDIDAIVHNEYHGDRRPIICPSRKLLRCWANVLLAARSTDGGKTFNQRSAPDNLIAALPYRYEGEVGHPIGYFQPSNIVKLDDYYYVLFKTTPYLDQKGGVCAMRTKTLEDPQSWRAWDGTRFAVQFVNPYLTAVGSPQEHVCTPVRGKLLTMGGMARDPSTGAFVLVMQGRLPQPGGHFVTGIWATASYNLIDWLEPVLVWRDPADDGDQIQPTDDDPSLLDPTSDSSNFETFGQSPYIYFVRHNLRNQPYDRQLMRARVQIKTQ